MNRSLLLSSTNLAFLHWFIQGQWLSLACYSSQSTENDFKAHNAMCMVFCHHQTSRALPCGRLYRLSHSSFCGCLGSGTSLNAESGKFLLVLTLYSFGALGLEKVDLTKSLPVCQYSASNNVCELVAYDNMENMCAFIRI